MRLMLSWVVTAGRIAPCCSSSAVNSDGVSPLACLLTDDGGQHYDRTLSWINEGVAKVDAVMNAELPTGHWDRDAWGAKLKYDEVVIYSLYDEGYTEVLTPSRFRRALVAWREFLQSMPDITTTRQVDI